MRLLGFPQSMLLQEEVCILEANPTTSECEWVEYPMYECRHCRTVSHSYNGFIIHFEHCSKLPHLPDAEDLVLLYIYTEMGVKKPSEALWYLREAFNEVLTGPKTQLVAVLETQQLDLMSEHHQYLHLRELEVRNGLGSLDSSDTAVRIGNVSKLMNVWDHNASLKESLQKAFLIHSPFTRP